MSDTSIGPTVSTQWLADNLDRPDVKVLDGSFYLPAENRNAQEEFLAAHIPGAHYFDIDVVSDHASDLPHMFPSEAVFNEAVGAMGIANSDMVITCDGGKLTGACRVWWMFRAFGHGNVAVLDGGVGKWRTEQRRLESGEAAVSQTSNYTADFHPELVRDVNDILRLTGDRGDDEQIIDARAAGRFAGTAPEPREGMRSGHMPGAYNVPYDQLLQDDGTLKPADELKTLFVGAGADLGEPVVTSCGSGVSAAVLLLALDVLGHQQTALYDGSWSEWGSRQDTPIVT